MLDFPILTQSEKKSTRPNGEPPKACLLCHLEFPERVVGDKWAEICLSCKRLRYHHMIDFPPRYHKISLNSCEIIDGNKQAILAAKDWAESENKNLWLYGPPGSGKTHIASAAMWSGHIGVVRFVYVAEMLLEFQGSVHEHDELSTIKKYFQPFTLFDDVAAHRISDFTLEMFGLLLERFYSFDTKGLIFTSNLSPKQILDTMGERISSRLRGLAQPIKIEGKDWRIHNGQD